MKQAHGIQRFLAWLIDFSLMIPIYFLSWKVIEKLLKTYRHYPPVKRRGMIAFNQSDFEAFFLSVGFILLTAVVIKALSYLIYQRTMGEKLLGLKRLQADGSELERSHRLRMVLTSVFRISLVFLPGPLVGLFHQIFKTQYGEHLFFLSLAFLLLATFYLFLSPLIAYFKDDKVSWVEKFTKTRVYTHS